jgi:hypothetical protein
MRSKILFLVIWAWAVGAEAKGVEQKWLVVPRPVADWALRGKLGDRQWQMVAETPKGYTGSPGDVKITQKAGSRYVDRFARYYVAAMYEKSPELRAKARTSAMVFPLLIPRWTSGDKWQFPHPPQRCEIGRGGMILDVATDASGKVSRITILRGSKTPAKDEQVVSWYLKNAKGPPNSRTRCALIYMGTEP